MTFLDPPTTEYCNLYPVKSDIDGGVRVTMMLVVVASTVNSGGGGLAAKTSEMSVLIN